MPRTAEQLLRSGVISKPIKDLHPLNIDPMPFLLEPPTRDMQTLAKAVNSALHGEAKVSLFTRTEQSQGQERATTCVLIAAGTRRWTIESATPLGRDDKDEIVSAVRSILDRPRPIASKYQVFDL